MPGEGLAVFWEGLANNSGQTRLSLALGLFLAIRRHGVRTAALRAELDCELECCYLDNLGKLGKKEAVTCC